VKKIQDRQERSWCLLNGVDKENEVLWEEEELESLVETEK